MKKRKKILFIEYLIERKKAILVFLVVNLTYLAVHLLYQSTYEAFSYALLLNIVLGIILMGIDYYYFIRKYQELQWLENSITVRPVTAVKAEGCIEEEYQYLITCLKEELEKKTLDLDERMSNQMDYLTMWTHQIKTPVAALRLIVANLEHGRERTEIELELFRIEEYIGMVLQYQRIDTMTSDLMLKEYDLYSLVKQAVKKYSIVFIRKHLSLEFTEFMEKVLTDEKWLVFVIEQIISNATKYTKEGSIRIYLREGKQLVIEDTGIGIRSEDLSRVFERGYTGYNGRLDKKSTGIGLYLCKKILDRLGHKIHIESELSKGTKVILTLSTEQLDVRD